MTQALPGANELASWRELTAPEQARIWADLPCRKTILGLRFRLLPWSGEVLMAALIDLARQPNRGRSVQRSRAAERQSPQSKDPVELSGQILKPSAFSASRVIASSRRAQKRCTAGRVSRAFGTIKS